MSVTLTRLALGEARREQLVASVVRGMRVPPGEDWLARLHARRTDGTWELLLSGPRRKAPAPWEATVLSADRGQYRCLIAPELQSADGVRRLLRGLLWDRLLVTVGDAQDTLLGRAVEGAAWDLLTRAGLAAASARFTAWPRRDGTVRLLGTVERDEDGYHELVWCGVVQSVADLVRELGPRLEPGATAAVRVARPSPERERDRSLFGALDTSIDGAPVGVA